MRTYLLSRLGLSVLVVWGVLTLVFIILRLSGDPAVLMLPLGATEEQINEFRHQMGFDRPLPIQYWQFLHRAARLDFGESLRFQQPALPLVLERLPATAQLAFTALSMAILIGTTAAVLAVVYRGTALEFVAMVVALLGQATPVFWLGIMLILVFAVQLRWLPSGGRGTLEHMVLPAFTLAAYSSASIARLFRSSLLEVMGEDYVRTARAKGLSNKVVFLRHIVRNALLPVVTMVGLQAGTLLGGSVVTETVFSWPGVGRLTVQAIYNRDFPLVQASVAVLAITFVVINLLVDLLYAAIDPRIRLKS
ncbi:MAG: ABC transporter permease [Anaerolineae bacterium]